jgi:hypothetical protein
VKEALEERWINLSGCTVASSSSANQPSRVAHDRLKHTGSDPSTKTSVNGSVGAEATRQVLALGPVFHDLEPTSQRIASAHHRSPTLGAHRRVGHTLAQPVQMFIRQSHRHATLFSPHPLSVARFWDKILSPYHPRHTRSGPPATTACRTGHTPGASRDTPLLCPEPWRNRC